MTLVRFEGTTDRGPSGTLWNNVVDWAKGTLAIATGAFGGTDFYPYNAGDITLSTDSGSAATVQGVQFGVVQFAATAGTNKSAGYTRNENVDLTTIRQVCTEARVKPVANANTVVGFVGWSSAAAEAVFASGAIASGSSQDTLGLRHNDDLTVDLVACVAGTLSTLITGVASAVSRAVFHKFGVRVLQVTSSKYTIFASVDGVVKKVNVASTAVPQGAMKPAVVQTVASTTAPSLQVDWHFNIDTTPGSA